MRIKTFKKGYKPSIETISKYQKINKTKGVQYKYFETTTKNKWNKLPNFLLLKPLREGITDKFSFDKIENSETYFGLVMHKFIEIEKDGDYKFTCGSNDGSKLYLDNTEIINNDGLHGYTEKSKIINLKKGEHLLEARYFQAGGGKHLKIYMEKINK